MATKLGNRELERVRQGISGEAADAEEFLARVRALKVGEAVYCGWMCPVWSLWWAKKKGLLPDGIVFDHVRLHELSCDRSPALVRVG